MESTSDGAKDPLDEAGRSSSAGLQVVCGIRRTLRGTKKNYKSFRNPDTYDLAGGLALEGHSPLSSPVFAEQSEGRVLPFLDPSASPVGEAFLFFSPPAEGEASFSSSPSSREESASESSDDESDNTWRWELFRVPVAFFLAFFSGTT